MNIFKIKIGKEINLLFIFVILLKIYEKLLFSLK